MMRNHKTIIAIRKLLVLFLILLFALSACDSYGVPLTMEEKSIWLSENSIRVNSILPTDEEFTDLIPLKEVIGDAQIVLLGEQSHGDGSTFLAKARLIKFLHQEMGFDVLAFESGLYDCKKTWELIQSGEEAEYAIQQGVFHIWSESDQVQHLIDYIGVMAVSENPLEIAGFDSQFTGSASFSHLIVDLEEFLRGNNISIESSTREKFVMMLRHLILETYNEVSITEEQYDEFLDTTNELRKEIQSSTGQDNAEASFWVQQLESIETQVYRARHPYWKYEGKTVSVVNMRDNQMGQNLIWLANERYPNRKIIVWAATFHNARNLNQIDMEDVELQGFYDEMTVMGDIVWEAFGDQIYSLGFTAYSGAAGGAMQSPENLERPSEGSFEDLMNRAGLENAIVDFRNPPHGGEWLQNQMASRPLGYVEMTASWPNILDGMMFTRNMIPSTGHHE